MFIERIVAEGLVHFSYLVGSGGEAVVIDPRRDGEVYTDLAREREVRISHIFETHRNEDYVIGSLDLARRTGAEIHHGGALPFGYGKGVKEGDRFRVGRARLSVLETPGHTDESLSFVLADRTYGEEAVAVFTGDALLIGGVGRTDLLPRPGRRKRPGCSMTTSSTSCSRWATTCCSTRRTGRGRSAERVLAERDFSSLGYERKHNPALQHSDRAEFVRYKMTAKHYLPPYFRKMEQYNLEGPPPLGELSRPRGLRVGEWADAEEAGMVTVDVRGAEAFCGAHVPGSLALPLGLVPAFAGWFLPYDRPLGLVADTSEQVETAVRYLVRLGYDRVEAYLEGGMHGWELSGREFATLPAVSAGELLRRRQAGEDFLLVDVRAEGEYAAGHVPGARHVYLGEMPGILAELPRDRRIVTFCGSGRRAAVAASLLQQAGFERVENCLGSVGAWRALGGPVETG